VQRAFYQCKSPSERFATKILDSKGRRSELLLSVVLPTENYCHEQAGISAFRFAQHINNAAACNAVGAATAAAICLQFPSQ